MKKIAKKIATKPGVNSMVTEATFPFKLGDKTFIRTVTMYHLGKIRSMGCLYGLVWIELDEGGWVADTKRFSDTLRTGVLNEYEKAPGPFIVWLGAGVDMFHWTAEIPAQTI